MNHTPDFPHFEGDMLSPAEHGEHVIIYNPVNLIRMQTGVAGAIDRRFIFFEGSYAKWRRRKLNPGAVQHYINVDPHLHLAVAYVFNMAPGCIISMDAIDTSLNSIAKMHRDIHGILRVPYHLDYFQSMPSATWRCIMASLERIIRNNTNLRVEIWYHKDDMPPAVMHDPEIDDATHLRIIHETSRRGW